MLASSPVRWAQTCQARQRVGPFVPGQAVVQVSREQGLTAWLAAGICQPPNWRHGPFAAAFLWTGSKSTLVLSAERLGRRPEPGNERTTNRAGYAVLRTRGGVSPSSKPQEL